MDLGWNEITDPKQCQRGLVTEGAEGRDGLKRMEFIIRPGRPHGQSPEAMGRMPQLPDPGTVKQGPAAEAAGCGLARREIAMLLTGQLKKISVRHARMLRHT